ncbi:MAG TPA: phytoene/squalene synthase family protein [Polyangia bacterium]
MNEAQGAAALVLRRDDRLACRAWIQRHSKSFFLSSLLLPARVRQASWALYAFCRRADDAVDEEQAGGMARVESLRRRLDGVYAGRAADDAIDRAFSAVVERYRIPRALPEALLAGMEMDARGARYGSDEELLVYCFRVAATVGLMMTRVMGASDDIAYLRAADLGVAMQLTNIARDVGEDERRGRVYLPAALVDGVSGDRRAATRAILARADGHYRAADRGVPLLPRDCRLAIASARRIYAAIGAAIARNGYDSVSRRAYVSLPRKLLLVASAWPARFGGGDARAAAARAAEPGPADEQLRALVRGVGLAT